jgi:hypothetical protein
VRPLNERLSSSAMPSGTITSSGTLNTVKIPVACMLVQKKSNTGEALSNRAP